VVAFYEMLESGSGGEVFRSTEHTGGPWDPGAQHGGPPAALLGRALERCAPRPDTRLARVTVEILGPVPVGELTVHAGVARPGRRVELVEARATSGGREVLRASGWRICAEPGRAPARDPGGPPPPVLPATARGFTFDGGEGFAYGRAVEWRFAAGAPDEPGPAEVWTRLRGQVVAGEEPTGWQRVLAVADSGNGLSAELPLAGWLFINPELTVHLVRPPRGEWVCVQARTSVDTDGIGLAETSLADVDGRIGAGMQSLLVARR